MPRVSSDASAATLRWDLGGRDGVDEFRGRDGARPEARAQRRLARRHEALDLGRLSGVLLRQECEGSRLPMAARWTISRESCTL